MTFQLGAFDLDPILTGWSETDWIQ